MSIYVPHLLPDLKRAMHLLLKQLRKLQFDKQSTSPPWSNALLARIARNENQTLAELTTSSCARAIMILHARMDSIHCKVSRSASSPLVHKHQNNIFLDLSKHAF